MKERTFEIPIPRKLTVLTEAGLGEIQVSKNFEWCFQFAKTRKFRKTKFWYELWEFRVVKLISQRPAAKGYMLKLLGEPVRLLRKMNESAYQSWKLESQRKAA